MLLPVSKLGPCFFGLINKRKYKVVNVIRPPFITPCVKEIPFRSS